VIRRLRVRHRRWILVVAAITAILAIVGLRARRAVPTVDAVPSAVGRTIATPEAGTP